MHPVRPLDPIDPDRSLAVPSVDLVLDEARRLHRAATSSSVAASLPVLRRLLASGALPPSSLPDAFRARDSVRRKHLLRMLALEAGFASWEAWRPALGAADAPLPPLLELARHGPGRLNAWFADAGAACDWAARHGGSAIVVGSQAVVVAAAT